jgi:hypothetical protein
MDPANLLTKWHWIVELARNKPGTVLFSLNHVIDFEWMREALYEGFEVKHYLAAFFTFFHFLSLSFTFFILHFLYPRAVSLSRSIVSRPRLDSPRATASRSLWSDDGSEGSSLSGTRNSRRNLVSGRFIST